MPRVADAKCPVNEHFNLQGGVFYGFKKISGRRFACHNNAAKADFLELFGRKRVVRRSLRACMEFKGWKGAVQCRRHTEVSNDESIHACVCGFLCGRQGGRDLAVANKRIECKINLDTIAVRAQNGGAQCVSAEIVGIHSCIKCGTAEINGIGTAFNRRIKCLGRTRRA